MSERMLWIATPIVLTTGARYQPADNGGALPQATLATYAAMQGAAPLTFDEVACILVGLHPCQPEAGDDSGLVEHKRRVFAKLEADAARGIIGEPLTLHEAVTWARGIGLPIAPALTAPSSAEARLASASNGASVAHSVSTKARRFADYDPDLDAKGRDIAECMRAHRKKPVKKAVAHELKRRFNLDQGEAAIIRRIRSYR